MQGRLVSGRGTVAVTFLVAAALGGGTAAVAIGTGHDTAGHEDAAPAGPPPADTATVTRTDLVATVQVDGSLDYGTPRQVVGRGSGTVTSLPGAGQTIERGQTLYGLDGAPVPLFYGTVPFWRTMSVGVPDGDDVLELQQNLAALGYQGFTVDRHFGRSTHQAVEQWQHDLGVDQTGAVALGSVAVEPAAVRVATISVALGGTATGTLLTLTGTAKEVTVPMPVGQAVGVTTVGAAVALELPGGRRSTGHIDQVGSVATPAGGSGTGAGAGAGAGGANGVGGTTGTGATPATQNATIAVAIGLDKPSDVAGLDGSPVTVDFTGDTRRGVLAVPVSALLATPDNGFGVETVAADGTRRTVPVQVGMFANGLVEVTGEVTAGTKVTVAGT